MLPLQHNQQADALLNRAFQALLTHRQATYLLINCKNQLLHVCGDSLGLLTTQTVKNSYKDILQLLPSSLKLPVGHALHQAKTNELNRYITAHPIELANGERCIFTIEAYLHPADQATAEFLSVLIEQTAYDSSLEGVCDRTSPEISASAHTHLFTSSTPEAAELIAVNQRLRAEVLERQQTEQKLAYKAEALARSNADLEEFAYVVSHDLQEPLRAMTAFSQLLSQRYEHHLDESAKRYIKHIVDGGTRMKAMIDGILELSRINSTQLNDTPTDLEQALDIVLENLKLIRSETQATITHSALPKLQINRNHIVQLLQNLIGNAIKFRGPAPPKIHITAQQQTTGWLFAVCDNGVGVPLDQQKRIFKLFQRLHNQQEQKGYGIGLAICKKIVEYYQGIIWLESSPGEGSTFYFTLNIEMRT